MGILIRNGTRNLFYTELNRTRQTQSPSFSTKTSPFVPETEPFLKALEEKRHDDALSFLKTYEEVHFARAQAMIEMDVCMLRSTCYEKMGEVELAAEILQRAYDQFSFHLKPILKPDVFQSELGMAAYFSFLGLMKEGAYQERLDALRHPASSSDSFTAESSWDSEFESKIPTHFAFNRAMREERYEDALEALDLLEQKRLEIARDFVHIDLAILRSKYDEATGAFDLAIQGLKSANEGIEEHTAKFEIYFFESKRQSEVWQFYKYYVASEIIEANDKRQAALLLHLGQCQEAAQLLAKYQPEEIDEAFLYGLIGKKLGLSLIDGVPSGHPLYGSDLFIFGEFEKANQLLREKYPHYLILRAACLVLLGESDEAMQLIAENHLDQSGPYLEKRRILDMILYLNGKDWPAGRGVDGESMPWERLMSWVKNG